MVGRRCYNLQGHEQLGLPGERAGRIQTGGGGKQCMQPQHTRISSLWDEGEKIT